MGTKVKREKENEKETKFDCIGQSSRIDILNDCSERE